MPLSLEHLLRDPELDLQLVVRGRLDRTVRWVHASELPAPAPPYLRGGEVILSAGLWSHESDPASYVQALVRCDAVALGCGLRTGVTMVDPALIAACERADLTLFAVPHHIAFVGVVERFVALLKRESESALHATINRSARLVNALGTGPSGAFRIMTVLREELERDVWLVNHIGRVLEPPGNARRIRPEQFEGRRPSELPTVASTLGLDALPVGGTSARTWLLVEPVDDPEGETIIAQALPFLASARARERAELEAERRHAVELVDLVLAGQDRFARARLDALGFELRRPILAAEIDDAGTNSLEAARQALDAVRLDGFVVLFHGRLLMLAQDNEARPALEIAEELHRALGPTCRVGLGSSVIGVGEIRRSIVEARESLALARGRLTGARWATAEELSTYRVFLDVQDSDVLETFRRSLVGPIEEHDERRGSDLLTTLTAFLESNGQWRTTATTLNVHVNTLRHRLARCEELTGRNLSRMEDRVDLFLAIRSLEGRGAERAGD